MYEDIDNFINGDDEVRNNKIKYEDALSEAHEYGIEARIYEAAGDDIKSDMGCIKILIAYEPETIQYVPDSIKNDVDSVIEIMETDVNVYNYLPTSMKVNSDILAVCAEHKDDFKIKFDNMSVDEIKAVTSAIYSEFGDSVDSHGNPEPYEAMPDEDYYITDDDDWESVNATIYNVAPDKWVCNTRKLDKETWEWSDRTTFLTDDDVKKILTAGEYSYEVDGDKHENYAGNFTDMHVEIAEGGNFSNYYEPEGETMVEKLNDWCHTIKAREDMGYHTDSPNFLSAAYEQARAEYSGRCGDGLPSDLYVYQTVKKRAEAFLQYGELSEADREKLTSVREAADFNITAIEYAKGKYDVPLNREQALLAVKWRANVINNLPENLKNDKEFIEEAAKLNPFVVQKSELAKNDRSIVVTAMYANAKAFSFASPEIQKDIFLDCVEQYQELADNDSENISEHERNMANITDMLNPDVFGDKAFAEEISKYDIVSKNQDLINMLNEKSQIGDPDLYSEAEKEQYKNIKDFADSISEDGAEQTPKPEGDDWNDDDRDEADEAETDEAEIDEADNDDPDFDGI